MAEFKFTEYDFECKSGAVEGVFAGYGSVFGNVDRQRDVVERGAYSAFLADLERKGRKLPIHWQHDQSQPPIGVWDVVKEDDRGLYVEGRLLTKEVPLAQSIAAAIREKAVSGISIGYSVNKARHDPVTGVRHLIDLALVELSIVGSPANDLARIDTIKTKLAYGTLPTLPEFEKLLREAGFSKTQAAVVANRGLAHLLRSESEAPATSSARDLVEALKGFSLT